MGFKRQGKVDRQIIRFEQNVCNASISDNEVLFVKVKSEIRTKDDLIEVPYTHDAYVIKGGGNSRFLRSGTHRLFDTDEEYKNFNQVGYSLDVIYIPRETNVNILWGTPSQFKYRDEASNKVISVGARGQFKVSISNPEQFYRKVAAAADEFDKDRFQAQFLPDVVNEFVDGFLQVVKENKLTYDRFDANRKQIGISVGKILSDKFDKSWGVELNDFIIVNFLISTEDMAAVEDAAAEAVRQQKLKEYLSELERLDDKNWEREKYLRQLEMQDRAAYYEVLKIIGHPSRGANATGGSASAEFFCPNCGNKVRAGEVFCSKCGKKVVKDKLVCSKCNHENESTATFCVACGEKLK